MNTTHFPPTLGPCEFPSPLDARVFIDDGEGILVDLSRSTYVARRDAGDGDEPPFFEPAGPREKVFFEAGKIRAGIVTCGGLCPGINDVIRGLVMVLWHRYGVRSITGYRFGYEGLTRRHGHTPLVLTPEVVEDIHKDGGTILGSSRGSQSIDEMVDYLREEEIDILFAIGGDGTQKGALAIADEIDRRGERISVIGMPKTIDNDLAYTTRTFGFETAVCMAYDPIVSAHNEARGAINGIGLVKLMGRDSGFIAAHATVASGDVNLVLVPEEPFTLEGLYAFLDERLARKHHAVIVVAEGAGQDLVPVEGTDRSGNRKLGDIGPFLKTSILEHFKARGVRTTVKYIDPSYTIRSAPATPDDSVFSFALAGGAVHAAMAGRTRCVIGYWNGHLVHVPTEMAVSKRKRIDTSSLLWQHVLDNTGQPRLAPTP